MVVAVQSRPPAPQPARCGSSPQGHVFPRLPVVVLPVLTRSLSLLTLLLQDGAIDLELASSVVGLDPGLAFATLQLANRKRAEGSNPIWQLPLAVVEAGREALEQYLQRAPSLESVSHVARRRQLERLAADAVVRACVAHLLARELGECNPRKAFLCGLLFELPVMAHSAHSPVCPAEALLPAMCRILPAGFVRAAMTGASEELPDGEALVAAVLLADAVVQAPAGSLEELVASPRWNSWNETDAGQRKSLLQHGCDLAAWAAVSLHRMHPWEFMARLEGRNCWR